MTNGADSSELGRLEERLAARFVPPLGRADVAGTIDDVLALFDNAPVRTYVLVLVERIATDRLRLMMAAGDRVAEAPSPAPTTAGDGQPTDSSSAEGEAFAGVRGVRVR